MCGIAGYLNLDLARGADGLLLGPMLDAIVHRGPDEVGQYVDGPIAMGTRRLSILDLTGGQQPLSNEDGTVWVSYNGETFNFPELKRELEAKGHRFRSRCDTEALVHLYEEHGDDLVKRLNGQFAFALWDRRRRRLLLARDRLGIRPLYWTRTGDRLAWASEVKALLALPGVTARLDPVGLQQVFTYAAPAAPRTMFAGVSQVPAGCLMVAEEGQLQRRTWWDLDFPEAGEALPDRGEAVYARELAEMLEDSVRLQLASDVPVGVYVSGGLDSSVIAGLVARLHMIPLRTFSIGFQDRWFNELPHARSVAQHLGAEAHEVLIGSEDVRRGLPLAIHHTEHATMITEAVPLMQLAQLARKHVTVVLTGEGADEAFGGYDYFRLDKARQILGKFPFSLAAGAARWLVTRKLGADFVLPARRDVREVERRYGFYPAMQPEFEFGERLFAMLASERVRAELGDRDPVAELELPRERIARWHPFDQATYVAYKIRLQNHQIGPLGDRVTMAASVEGRYPFLDHRFVEMAARIPRHHKLRGFREKHILRTALGHLMPPEVAKRTKQAFQSPCATAVLKSPGAYVDDLISEETVRARGYFDPAAVTRMISTLKYYWAHRKDDLNLERATAELGVIGVITTHLWHEMFVEKKAPSSFEP